MSTTASTTPSLTYDAAADVLGVWLAPDDGTAITRVVAPGVHVDVDASGRLVSVEVLDASGQYARAALEALAAPAELLTLAEAAEESGLAQATLRGLLNRGRLAGVKRGRDWLVTAAALWSYLDSRDARGRKPVRTKPVRPEPTRSAKRRVVRPPAPPRRAAAREQPRPTT